MSQPIAYLINQPQIEALRRDGMFLAPDAVPADTIAHLLNSLSRLPPAHAHRNLLDVPEIRQFAMSPSTLQFIVPFLGPHAFPVRGILFDKTPDANWKVAWHQDLSIAVKHRHEIPGFGPWSVKEGVPHVQPPVALLENMLTLRLHLDDCLQENGPVRVLPATHNLGILSPEQTETLRTQRTEIPALLATGGILLMRPLLLHASSAAKSPNHRRVIHIEYAAEKLPPPLHWYES